MCYSKTYSEPCQTSKMECFAKIINDFYPLTTFAKEPFSKKCDIWCHKGHANKNEKQVGMLCKPR